MVCTGAASPLGARYEVPALLTDVAPAEGLLQAFDALQALDAVITDVFTRLQGRITEERGKIGAVVARVSRAQGKVQEIGANSSRVTSIFSTAKYPAAKVLPDFRRIIDADASATTENSGLFLPVVRPPHRLAASDRFASAPPADTSALFASLTGARLMRTEHAAADEETEVAEGLGRLPAYLPSISSVLLFNSDENPYKQYVTINNLEGVGGQDRTQDASGPSAAPRSLIDGLELPTYAGFTFEYKPMLGEMPTFDLPQNLPLGRLADITFGADAALSIAPSMASLALPSLDLPMLTSSTATRQQVQSAVPAGTPTAPTTTTPVAPTPTNTTAVPTAPVPTAPVPTAPVPSAPAPTTTAAAVKPPAAAGGRGALLDAIRDAKNAKKLRSTKGAGAPGGGRPTGGRAGLKPVSKAPAGGEGEEGEPAKKPPPSDGGDLMSALRDQMARRAVAMSGKGEVDGAAKPAPRRMSVAPRLQAPQLNTSALKRPGVPAAAKKTVPEGDDEPAAAAESSPAVGAGKMSSAVLSAYVSAHAAKQDKDDEWE